MNVQLLPEIAANPPLAPKTWLRMARAAVTAARLWRRDASRACFPWAVRLARAARHLACAVEYREAARSV